MTHCFPTRRSSDISSALRAMVGVLLDLFVDALALAFPAGSAFAGGFVGLLRLGAEAHLHHLVVRLVDEIGALRHDARGVEQAVDVAEDEELVFGLHLREDRKSTRLNSSH